MTGENVTSSKVPKLRFREFQGSWIDQKGKDLFENRRTKGKTDLPIYSVTLRNGLVPRDSLERAMREDAEITTNLYAKTGDLAYNMMRMWQGAVGVATEDCIVSPAYVVLAPKPHIDSRYFNYLLSKPKSIYNLWAYSYGLTDDRLRLYYQDFGRIPFCIPSIPEQQKIALFLSVVNEKIEKLKAKKSLLEKYKKGVMQKIFSREIRFQDENGKEYSKWEEKELGELLDYEQPTNYLVKREEYNDSYKTPVLTAGKTFILGYTNETTGIFNKKLPVIIFDDFTTATQFVDFSFKAKSSAMKILIPKGANDIRFLYEVMQEIKYNVGGHGRHWISIFAKILISVPSIPEQQKVASFLSEIDKKINTITTEIESTEKWKKGLLQGMFI